MSEDKFFHKTMVMFFDHVLKIFILQLIEKFRVVCSTPFELHDDAFVLKAMSLQEQQGGDSVEILGDTDFDDNGVAGNMEDERPSLISGLFQHAPHSSSPYYGFAPGAGKSGQWPPVPGILKARVKHENLS